MQGLRADGEDFAVLLTPDHPTPIETRTHSSDPVPFVLYSSIKNGEPNAKSYTEAECAKTGLFLSDGPELMKRLINLDF